jgi:hypothetical protein
MTGFINQISCFDSLVVLSKPFLWAEQVLCVWVGTSGRWEDMKEDEYGINTVYTCL